jgi:hypothetical protein
MTLNLFNPRGSRARKKFLQDRVNWKAEEKEKKIIEELENRIEKPCREGQGERHYSELPLCGKETRTYE